MRLLFEIDLKNYNKNGTVFSRPSVRGIIIRDGKIAMVHSLKYNYYKFPGGGTEKNESHQETLIREVKEETGLTVIPETIREYGWVHRIQKGMKEDMFVQDNYYYLCDAGQEIEVQQLDVYEDEEQFTLEFVTPEQAIMVNQSKNHSGRENDEQLQIMLDREVRVLELLVQEEIIR